MGFELRSERARGDSFCRASRFLEYLESFDGSDNTHTGSDIGSLCEMSGAEVAVNAAAPGLDERIVERAAYCRAGERDYPANPFFGALFANAHCNLARETRGEFFHHLLFDDVLAEVNAGGRSGSHPEFQALIFVLFLKTIEQAETLNKAEGDDGQKASVRNQRDHPAETETRTLCEGKALRVVHQTRGDSIEFFDGHILHASEMRHPKPMLFGEVLPKVFGVNFNGAQPA
jgi:hypothetical protein